MSISATSNYMSNTEILAWMENKTEGLYGHMRDAMDVANTRADAESALADIKAAIANTKLNGGDAAAVHQAINDALEKYKDVPEVAEVLQPMADKLNGQYDAAAKAAYQATKSLEHFQRLNAGATGLIGALRNGIIANLQAQTHPAAVKITSDEIDAWTGQIDKKVDALGKQDQLGMINIQEFNSQLNQAKQTASALMDSADKSASAIINHIA